MAPSQHARLGFGVLSRAINLIEHLIEQHIIPSEKLSCSAIHISWLWRECCSAIK